MKPLAIAVGIAAVTLGSSTLAEQGSSAAKSGIDRSNFDPSVRPQDDFFRYVNGGWLARTEIPADHTSVGSFIDLRDEAERHVRSLIEDLAKGTKPQGSQAQQIGDLYVSYMDEARADAQGFAPLKPELAKIDAVASKADLARRLGELAGFGIGGMSLDVSPDAKQPTATTVAMGQSGITLLPDRDYYLKDDPKLADVRTKYVAYLEKIYTLLGRPDPAGDAKAVMALETEVAKAQWPAADLRDPVKRYNKFTLQKLAAEMPGFDWNAWAAAQNLASIPEVIVGQPSFFKAYASLADTVPLATWKAWLTAQLVSDLAPYLSKPFVDARFDFFDRTMRGQQAMRPRAERAVTLVNTSLGEAVGKIYVDKYFPPQAKVRMQQMVTNLLEAYRQSISTVEWMTPETRTRALDKLSKFLPQIGYPDTWRSYSGLVIKPDDLAGNVMRLQRFEREYRQAKLGKQVDRTEWGMTPQTVNAYYSPLLNKIVFPAAILQPPFFQFDADDAVNYGAIGAVIGHEIGHGFDDQGRQFDGTGALHDWWQPLDDQEFRKRAGALVEQFNAYTPLPGLHVNGQLTLGENIGDLAGLGIAYKAYKVSLGGKPAPVIDGLSGEQRLFLGFGQIWRAKMRDEQMRVQVMTNPHSPGEYRANGPVSNIDAFYDAFSVKPGDKMYRAPDQRVRIW
jgi:putative endopeptidase